MNKYFLSCIIWGYDFYPTREIANLSDFVIHSMNDKGEIGTYGRYKNIPHDFGSLILEPKNIDVTFGIILTEFFKNLIKLRKEAIFSNLDMSICIDMAYQNQCNFELSIENISYLHELSANFGITCYESE